MGPRADVVRRLVLVAAFAWIARWAALEIASYASRHWVSPARPLSTRSPGRMPGPSD